MSTKSLRDHLIPTLNRLKTADGAVRVAVLGIGNELHGDDAAGILAARALLAALPVSEHVLVIEAGPAPENTTGALRRFRPDVVLLIDAAQMGESAGTVRWLAWQDTSGISASTHTLPLHMLAWYLHEELGCEIALIGIQPAGNTMFAPISEVVEEVVNEVVGELIVTLS